MKVLVTVASKHGATWEIGETIAATLKSAGLDVAVIEPTRVESIKDFDAVVVGSGIYLGRWLAPAREFVQENAPALTKKPVWLFASGPITPGTINDPGDTAEGLRLKDLIGARDAIVFAGQLKKDDLGVLERVSVAMVHSPWGDYRPWDEIRTWAESIAEQLKAVPVG